jgi:hypothetical protein
LLPTFLRAHPTPLASLQQEKSLISINEVMFDHVADIKDEEIEQLRKKYNAPSGTTAASLRRIASRDESVKFLAGLTVLYECGKPGAAVMCKLAMSCPLTTATVPSPHTTSSSTALSNQTCVHCAYKSCERWQQSTG